MITSIKSIRVEKGVRIQFLSDGKLKEQEITDDFYGLSPEYMYINEIVLLGYNFKLYIYNEVNNVFTQFINLDSLFYTFEKNNDLIIVICEWMIYLLDFQLNIKKVIHLDDIITNWIVEGNSLKIKLFEGCVKYIDLNI